MKPTGAAILISRGMKVLQAAPAAYPYRSACGGAAMADAALRRLWAAVRRDFDRARALLPSPPAEAEGSVTRLGEWLDHNELELALDELESLGEDNAAPSGFWEHLRSAAERMGLAEHQARLARRAAQDAEPGAAPDRRGM